MIGSARVRRPRPFVLVGVVMVLAFAFAFANPGSSAPAQASIGIFDDDGGKALFPSTKLAPGKAYSQCLLVTASPESSSDVIALSAVGVSGSLAGNLQVRVEAGAGGRYGDCSGFSGSSMFNDTLGKLAAANATKGITVPGWNLDTGAARAFRITVWLAAGAQQGTTTGGRFVWELRGDGNGGAGIDPTPTPTRSGGGPGTGGSETTGTDSGGSGGRPTDGSNGGSTGGSGTGSNGSAGPSRSGDVNSSNGSDGDDGAGGKPTGNGPTGAPSITLQPVPQAGNGVALERNSDLQIGLDRIASIVSRAQTAVVAVVVEPQYPLLAILLAVAFLVLQDVIDRRDPKFAGVARRKDNEVDFPDRFGSGRKA